MIKPIVNELLLLEPFFGFLALKLKYIEKPEIKTMAVDGIHFYYNPSFVRTETKEHLVADVVHELLHCVLDHITRGKHHQKQISNYAADYVVNDYIKNKTNFKLQPWVLYEPRFSNMSYEAVYKILLDESGGTPDSSLTEKSERQGTFFFDPNNTTEEIGNVTVKDYWETNIQEAATMMKTIGAKIDSNIEALINATKPAQLPWFKLLKRFLINGKSGRTNWQMPSRRNTISSFFLPARHKGKLNHIVIAIDTSCSVTDNEFQHIIGEVNKIVSDIKPAKVSVIHCDTDVRMVNIYRPKSFPLKEVKMYGRGGTAFKPVFDYIAEKKLAPTCLLYFTDMWGYFNFTKPKYPVLWINTDYPNNQVAPFGTTIGINTK